MVILVKVYQHSYDRNGNKKMNGIEPKLFELAETYSEQMRTILRREPTHFRRNNKFIINCFEVETIEEAACLVGTIKDNLNPTLKWLHTTIERGFFCSPGSFSGKRQTLVVSLVWGVAEFRGKKLKELSIMVTIGDGPITKLGGWFTCE